MTPISKERTKFLEENSFPYIMILAEADVIGLEISAAHNMYNWNNGDREIFNKGLYEKVRYISNKLNMKQTYYRTYFARNAVWGIEHRGNEYVLYFSNEGLGLQTAKDTSCNDLMEFIYVLTKAWSK